jgi:hypothetical protein
MEPESDPPAKGARRRCRSYTPRPTPRYGDALVLGEAVGGEARAEFMTSYMLSPELALSVDEHEAIVEAFERVGHSRASDLVRENFDSGMPEVEVQLRDRHGG